MTIKVLVCDDHDVVREGLAGFLRTLDDMTLAGEAEDGQAAVRLALEHQPDVVLMDLKMPRMDGVEATKAIRALPGNIQIVILTSFDDQNLVQEALRAGAIGYLLKNSSVQEMAAAVRAAYDGKTILSPEATQALIQAKQTKPTTHYNLKPRELEVLALLTDGLTNQQIAQALSISSSTVKFHVSSILAKLSVESRTEAVAVALREGLLDS